MICSLMVCSCYNFSMLTGRSCLMSFPSLEAKKAYFAKARKDNYWASLRLEGFDMAGWERKYQSREAAVIAHTREKDTSR